MLVRPVAFCVLQARRPSHCEFALRQRDARHPECRQASIGRGTVRLMQGADPCGFATDHPTSEGLAADGNFFRNLSTLRRKISYWPFWSGFRRLWEGTCGPGLPCKPAIAINK